MTTSLKNMSKADKLKFIITFLPILMVCIPVNEVFTSQMRTFFIITLIGIISFCLDSIPQTTVALMLPAAYVFFGVCTSDVAFKAYSMYMPWYILAGAVMAVIMERTGFLYRVAYITILKTGATFKGIIIGITTAAALVALFAEPMVVPFAALSYGVVRALQLEKTPAAAAIISAGAVGSLSVATFKFTGPLLMIGIGESVTGKLELLGFFESLFYMAPMILLLVLLMMVLIVFFKPKEEISGKAYFQEKLEDLGPVSHDEKKVIAILLIFFLFVLFYKYTPFDISWGLVVVPLIMAFPVFGCGTKEDLRNVNYGFIFFVAACLSIGNVAASLGIGEIIKNIMMPIIEGRSVYAFFGLSWLMYIVMNFLMTPAALEAAFTLPLVSIASVLNVNPMAFFFFAKLAVDQVILPYESAMYMLGFAFGVMNLKDFVKFHSIKVILSTIIMFVVCLLWWRTTGFLFL